VKHHLLSPETTRLTIVWDVIEHQQSAQAEPGPILRVQAQVRRLVQVGQSDSLHNAFRARPVYSVQTWMPSGSKQRWSDEPWLHCGWTIAVTGAKSCST
jgi:hypothetical protein